MMLGSYEAAAIGRSSSLTCPKTLDLPQQVALSDRNIGQVHPPTGRNKRVDRPRRRSVGALSFGSALVRTDR